MQEIPEECLQERGRQSHRASGTGGYAAGTRSYTEHRGIPKPKPAVPLLELSKGDQVIHTAFGAGIVVNIMKMNGDALVEIAFDQVGTKRLMLKAAGPHLKRK